MSKEVKSVEDIWNIAFVSSNYDKEISDIIVEIHEKIGIQSIVSL